MYRPCHKASHACVNILDQQTFGRIVKMSYIGNGVQLKQGS